MPYPVTTDPDRLVREAQRCERLSRGSHDPALARIFAEWAADFRSCAGEPRRPH